jgi:hypothetical protein
MARHRKPVPQSMCHDCGDSPVQGRGSTRCVECADIATAAAKARRRARERLKGAKCAECGGVKPHGRGRKYCARCVAERSRARKCERCANPSRSPRAKLCADCKATARKAHAEAKARWARENPQTDNKAPSRETARMTRRMIRERQGVALKLVEPAPGERVDADEFPALPAKPLADAITKLIRAHAVGPDPKGSWTSITSGTGQPVDPFAGATEIVCKRLGVADRSYREWQSGRRLTVRFDVADRVVTRGGLLWWSVWPDCPEAERAFTGEVMAA